MAACVFCRIVADTLPAHKVYEDDVHVVPRKKKDGLRGFFWPRVGYVDDAEREDFAARIRAAL